MSIVKSVKEATIRAGSFERAVQSSVLRYGCTREEAVKIIVASYRKLAGV